MEFTLNYLSLNPPLPPPPLFKAKLVAEGINKGGGYSLHLSQVVYQAGAYPGFCSMKWLRVSVPPPPSPWWNASPSQGYPDVGYPQY